MKILSRFVMVLALLGGLAYASYFVGNRVVSKKMFGDVVAPRNGSGITTGKTKVRKSSGGERDVQVQVLPAENDSSNNSRDDTPSFSDLQRSSKARAESRETPNRETPNRDKLVRADALPTPGAKLGANNGDAVGEPTPRRKRRRRRRNLDSNSVRNSSGSSNEVARASGSTDNSGSNSNDNSSSEVPHPERSTNERSTNERLNRDSGNSGRRDSSSGSGGNDSPVPRAEGSSSGSSGGDSPVPQPE